MKIQTFEDILAWQKAKQLALLIYKIPSFNKDYGFRDQLQRAILSVMNNIAEGFERKSNKEFKQLYNFPLGNFTNFITFSFYVRSFQMEYDQA